MCVSELATAEKLAVLYCDLLRYLSVNTVDSSKHRINKTSELSIGSVFTMNRTLQLGFWLQYDNSLMYGCRINKHDKQYTRTAAEQTCLVRVSF